MSACLVDCVRPLPGKPNCAAAEMLCDPADCIECGVRAANCPVGAVFSAPDPRSSLQRYIELNAGYFVDRPKAAAGPGRQAGPYPRGPAKEPRLAVFGSRAARGKRPLSHPGMLWGSTPACRSSNKVEAAMAFQHAWLLTADAGLTRSVCP